MRKQNNGTFSHKRVSSLLGGSLTKADLVHLPGPYCRRSLVKCSCLPLGIIACPGFLQGYIGSFLLTGCEIDSSELEAWVGNETANSYGIMLPLDHQGQSDNMEEVGHVVFNWHSYFTIPDSLQEFSFGELSS